MRKYSRVPCVASPAPMTRAPARSAATGATRKGAWRHGVRGRDEHGRSTVARGRDGEALLGTRRAEASLRVGARDHDALALDAVQRHDGVRRSAPRRRLHDACDRGVVVRSVVEPRGRRLCARRRRSLVAAASGQRSEDESERAAMRGMRFYTGRTSPYNATLPDQAGPRRARGRAG